jgi:hypothetical protein
MSAGQPGGLSLAEASLRCRWAQAAGCRELASGALLENQVGHAVHRSLGFQETERVVFFPRQLS